jgi:hypothetical protein
MIKHFLFLRKKRNLPAMMSLKQQIIYDNLVKIAEENGCQVVSAVYTSSRTKMEFRCPSGHFRVTSITEFRKNPLSCKKCAGLCPIEAQKIFISTIEGLGGKVVGKYNGKDIKVECICPKSHICLVRPNSVRKGFNMCIKCAGQCQEDASANFITRIEKLGGKVLGEYKNSTTKVECLCSNNHSCFPIPGGIQQGEGMCRICAGFCPIEAGNRFVLRVEKQGGKVIGKYINDNIKIRCECSRGHICFPKPCNTRRGRSICKTCSYQQIESKGEKITSESLNKLNIAYTKEFEHPRLPSLRFDFKFDYENKLFLIEFDGFQHQKENKHFHRLPGDFEKQRQRDLMKNYLVKNVLDCVLIRLDHEWLKMDDPVESISEYIWEKMGEPSGTVVAENLLYMWIFDEPTEESINKYFIL